MMNLTLLGRAAAVCLFMSEVTGAQSVQPDDSVARRVTPSVTDSVRVTLRDGDYARLAIAHPLGLDVRVLRPNREELRLFANPGAKGTTPIAWVAEGAGDYTITVKNTAEAPVHYGLKFLQRVSLDERTRPVPAADAVTSPRIDSLRRRVQRGDTSTAEFWRQVEAEGTPIIESLDAKYDLVTFVWRTQYDTRSVHSQGPLRARRTRERLVSARPWNRRVVSDGEAAQGRALLISHRAKSFNANQPPAGVGAARSLESRPAPELSGRARQVSVPQHGRAAPGTA